MSAKNDFPFTIIDVANVLNLTIRHERHGSIDVDCPFCGDKVGKLNLNLAKDVYRCNRCEEFGGMTQLYAKVHGVSNQEAYRAICQLADAGKKNPSQTKRSYDSKKKPEPAARADVHTIHQTYAMLLSLLALAKPHQENLKQRGLDDYDILNHRFKSIPAYGQKGLCKQLIKSGCTLEGVPGFYQEKDGEWNVTLKASGIIIPIVGIDGLISGAQIRLDKPINDRKYIWLSSADMLKGAGSGSPAHFVGDPTAERVFLTEGALKGVITHSIAGHSVVSIPGVNATRSLDSLLLRLKQNGVRTVVEALDLDKFDNKNVQKAASKLRDKIGAMGLEVLVAVWNKDYNGVDDYYRFRRSERENYIYSADVAV